MNLNDTKSRGPLTADDLRSVWPMPGVDIDAVHHTHRAPPLTSCTGPCRQGREPCPCPDACLVTDNPLGCFRGMMWGLVFTAAAVAIGAAFWWALS